MINQEDSMTSTKKSTEADPTVDDMSEAPAERPYSEAITDEHRALLAENGVEVDQKP